jgi:hypothetical protein
MIDERGQNVGDGGQISHTYRETIQIRMDTITPENKRLLFGRICGETNCLSDWSVQSGYYSAVANGFTVHSLIHPIQRVSGLERVAQALSSTVHLSNLPGEELLLGGVDLVDLPRRCLRAYWNA